MVHSYLVSCSENGISHKYLCENCSASYNIEVDEGIAMGESCEDQGDNCEDC